MKSWPLSFISKNDFKKHVSKTILQYGKKLEPYDLKKFNKNIIDPIKLIFDKSIYGSSWSEIIKNEIFRQRDKSNNNDIGYFHQNIFKYFKDCVVPKQGWDVIYTSKNGINISKEDCVNKLYVELKNKHNTMNNASSSRTYIKMQNQILQNDNCACCLVEIIAKKSQNIKWSTKIEGRNLSHKLIRRISIDKFYEIVTDDKKAFYKMCLMLPSTISEILEEGNVVERPEDSVYYEIKRLSERIKIQEPDLAMILAFYVLGFFNYDGFTDVAEFDDLNSIYNAVK